MRQILFLIFILSIFSCNENKSKSEIESLNLLNIKISDDADIFGNWTMCSISGNGSMTQMNTCPIILFNPNGTGSMNNSPIGNFSWTLKDKKLRILCFNQNSNCIFPDTNYFVIFNKTKDRSELTIQQKKNDYFYYLSK